MNMSQSGTQVLIHNPSFNWIPKDAREDLMHARDFSEDKKQF